MLTKIDICSMALLKLGEKPIQSLVDESASAQLARTLFVPVVDSLIALHPWHFACQKIKLTKTSSQDFIIPSNILRVIKCPGHICGNRIVADGKALDILALVRVPTENFPGYFSSLVATRLAMEFCVPLTGDQTVFRMLTALYESELRSAKFIDSTLEPNACIDSFSLINARF